MILIYLEALQMMNDGYTGKWTKPQTNTPLIEVYDNGTVEKENNTWIEFLLKNNKLLA